MSNIEAGLDKEAMRSFWRARGGLWDRWADTVAQSAARMTEPLIEAIRLVPGNSVLDLASGAGQPALAIAARLAPGGEVVATDLVPEMLQGARRRAERGGLGNIRFEIADMEALPFPDARFDRVTCRFGIMFVPQPPVALGEVHRVLKPGGRAAFMVWGPREDTTMFRIIMAAADRVLGPDPDPGVSAIFRFGRPGSLGAMFRAAGFVRVEEQELRLSGRAPAGAPFWQPHLDMSLGPRLERVDKARRAALEQAIADGFAGEIKQDHCVLAAHVRIVTGEV